MLRDNPPLYLVYGPPGSGKTSVMANLPISYLSVGEITRKEISRKTVDGLALKGYLDRVVEYPPELIGRVVFPHLTAATLVGLPIVLDGFPKYEQEALPFKEMVKSCGLNLTGVINLGLSVEEALARVAGRIICSGCGRQVDISGGISNNCTCGGLLEIREDDQPHILRRRYSDYEKTVEKTIGALGKCLVIDINAERPLAEVRREFQTAMEKLSPGSSAERAPSMLEGGRRFESSPGLQKPEVR